MSDAAILAAVGARRQDLIGPAQDLIRIPTLNPPGEKYREICDYLGARRIAQGFEVDHIRAIGAPSDSDRYTRLNMVARLQGGPGP
mgnify:FL=1